MEDNTTKNDNQNSLNIVKDFIDNSNGKKLLKAASVIKTGDQLNNIEETIQKQFPAYNASNETPILKYENSGDFIIITDQYLYLSAQPRPGKTINTQIKLDDLGRCSVKSIHFGEFIEFKYDGTRIGVLMNPFIRAKPVKFFIELFDYAKRNSGKYATSSINNNIDEKKNASISDNELKNIIQQYSIKGFDLIFSDGSSAQLKKKKKFSWGWFIIWFICSIFLFGLPAIAYVLYYLLIKSESNVLLTLQDNGRVGVVER